MRIWGWIHEQVEQLYDPHQNPGQDLVVDETHHHSDHGLWMADFDYDLDHAFDNGFDHDFGNDFGGMDGF